MCNVSSYLSILAYVQRPTLIRMLFSISHPMSDYSICLYLESQVLSLSVYTLSNGFFDNSPAQRNTSLPFH